MKELIYPENGKLKVSTKKILWLYLMMVPCCFIDFSLITLETFLICTILIFLTICLGHSVGLHRGVIHKSYSTTLFVRNLLIYFFVLTGLGGPISWLKLHYFRDYWQNKKSCPKYFAYEHSLVKDYWWNLHLSFTTNDINKYNIPEEDLSNPWFKWLEKTWYVHNLLFALAIFLVFDLNIMLFLVCFKSLMTILGHWYIGYASHKYGYSHFEIEHSKESGYNDLLLGLISFGEGFHNNHHAHPSSAKFGLKWYEFDLGWQAVKLMRALKIITNVKSHEKGKTIKKSALRRPNTLCKFPI